MNKTVDTRICEVTVYDDQALVTRRGVVQLTGEEHELVIAQLPVTLISESVRASSSGTVAVRLLEVRTERTYTTEAIAPEIPSLTQEIEQLEEQKRLAQDLLTQLTLQRNFVKGLITQYLERLTKSQHPEPINLNNIKELLEFVGHQYSELSSAIATTEKEQQKLEKKLQTLRQQLNQLSTPRSQENFSIIITIEPSAVGEFELEVSYVINKASWIPLYDLRFSSTSEKVNLSYLAEVQQSTGEDWLDVALTLSTAKPELGTLPPQLTPWYIDVQHPNYLESRAKAKAEMDNIQPRTFYATLPFPGMTPEPEVVIDTDLQRLKAQMIAAEAPKPGGIIAFEVNNSGNIPGDGATHKTTIFSKDYSYSAEYVAIPQLGSLAYLETTIVNPLAGVTLLPGKVNIFRDNTFIGTTELKNISPGEEFKLNLGLDEGLKIERDLVERQVDQKLIDKGRHTTYAYRLVITNLRSNNAVLLLKERLPVSCNPQIKVFLTRTNPAIQMGEMGMLEWSLTLPPHSNQEVYYQFTVEHPPELTVIGLDI
jgi:uncharacterized protein (TIGR02231 family)